jgi:hypothetical protein
MGLTVHRPRTKRFVVDDSPPVEEWDSWYRCLVSEQDKLMAEFLVKDRDVDDDKVARLQTTITFLKREIEGMKVAAAAQEKEAEVEIGQREKQRQRVEERKRDEVRRKREEQQHEEEERDEERRRGKGRRRR